MQFEKWYAYRYLPHVLWNYFISSGVGEGGQGGGNCPPTFESGGGGGALPPHVCTLSTTNVEQLNQNFCLRLHQKLSQSTKTPKQILGGHAPNPPKS